MPKVHSTEAGATGRFYSSSCWRGGEGFHKGGVPWVTHLKDSIQIKVDASSGIFCCPMPPFPGDVFAVLYQFLPFQAHLCSVAGEKNVQMHSPPNVVSHLKVKFLAYCRQKLRSPRHVSGHIPLATSTTVLSGLDFCAKCDFCVKGWVRGICMWRILWFWCFLMI